MYSREYLYRFLRLTQNRQFEPYHWAWPGQHQPLFSILALIQHLEDYPDDPLAGETRRLIDLAILMATSQRVEGIVARDEAGTSYPRPLHEGGAETWGFIRTARDHVWTKLGLDPGVFRCPDDVRQIRFAGADFEDHTPTVHEELEFDAALEQFDGEWPGLDDADLWQFGGAGPSNLNF